MSNINELIQEIEEQIITYNLKAENQRNKTAMCYEGETLSYANWILGLHKDVSPNTTKTVYLYTNVCKKDDSMYKEYLLVRPDKKIDDDGKTLRKHMKEKYEEDEGALENNKKLLEKGRTELNRLQTEFNKNKELRNEKVEILKQKQEEVEQKQKELTDKKTIRKNEGLEDKLNEIKTELRDKEGELRDKEEQRDDIMNSLNTITTATPLPDTYDDIEETVQDTNDGREETVQTTEEMVQDPNDDYQRIENIQGGVDDDDNAGPTNEELEKLNEELEKLNEELQHLQQEKTDLEEPFTQINNRIQEQELGIATLEQTITEELKSIQTLTQELTELNKQGVSINNDIKLLDIVSTLEDEIEAHNENFDNKPNKLYEIKIKDFGNDNVQAVNVLNADYIDIGMLYEDVAYMVGEPIEDTVTVSEISNDKSTPPAKQPVVTGESISDSDSDTEPPTEDHVIISERDNTESTPPAKQPVVTGESTSDSDSDTGSDTVSISDIDILNANTDERLTDNFMTDNITPTEQVNTLTPSNTSSDNNTFEIDNTGILTSNEQPLLLDEVRSDNLTLQEQDKPVVISLNSDSYSDSDSDSDSNVNIKTSDIVTQDEQELIIDSLLKLPDTNILTQDSLEAPKDKDEDEDKDGYDEEAFFHDATPPLIEHLQIIEGKLKSYDDYENIKPRTVEAVKSIIKEDIWGPLKELYTDASIGDLQATLIITKLSNTIKKKDINKFLSMISDMKTSINEYYNTTDNNELKQLVQKFRKYRGGSVKKQKTKKQKPLRKNNSFRKKRKAKV